MVAGAVERHTRYGWQFAVECFRSTLPQTAEGVALWLRRRVPGIGLTFARAIVEHFGAEHVFAELDRDPERLREVRTKAGRAISRRAMERAVEAWREVAAIREVEAFLFSHGIGAGLAARLVRTYGTDVIAVLEDDPYRLTEVPRIGFRVADGSRARSGSSSTRHRGCARPSFVLGRRRQRQRFLPLVRSGRRRRGCSRCTTWTRSRRRSRARTRG